MHGHDLLLRQQVVEDGERGLLHLAPVAGAPDQHDLPGQVAGNDGPRARAVAREVGAERGQIDDREFWNEGGQILRRQADQEVADEQLEMPGVFGEDTRAQANGRVGARVEILGEEASTVLLKARLNARAQIQAISSRTINPSHWARIEICLRSELSPGRQLYIDNSVFAITCSRECQSRCRPKVSDDPTESWEAAMRLAAIIAVQFLSV